VLELVLILRWADVVQRRVPAFAVVPRLDISKDRLTTNSSRHERPDASELVRTVAESRVTRDGSLPADHVCFLTSPMLYGFITKTTCPKNLCLRGSPYTTR
jgi:hypothetical protein